ncbi:MAG: RagB/SusD family nutrient uptake outer membrane protein [Bacteroidales bacterium]
MKSINNIFCLLATAILAWSCNDFLNEYDPNSVTEDNFYENEDDIHTSMNGVYASLKQSFYFTNGYYFSDVRAHETAVTDAGANSGIPYQFYNYSLNEENAYVYNRYTQIYKSIVRANTLISHLDDVTYSNPDSRDSYEAQARFVRALGYYYLVTEWGDVPLILKALSSFFKSD